MKYILTGGPNTGKTTMINMLSRQHPVCHEVARQIIYEELDKQKHNPTYTPILPSNNLINFQYLVLDRQIKTEPKTVSRPTFLDRSLLDGLAYLKSENIFDQYLSELIYKTMSESTYKTAFLLHPNPNHKTNRERRESKLKSYNIHQCIIEVYQSYGFDLIHVPWSKKDKRLEHILSHI